MSEPNYEYVRGTGWVPVNSTYMIPGIKIRGATITLVNRLPEIGERYARFAATSEYVVNGKVNIEKFADYLRRHSEDTEYVNYALNDGHRIIDGDVVCAMLDK